MRMANTPSKLHRVDREVSHAQMTCVVLSTIGYD